MCVCSSRDQQRCHKAGISLMCKYLCVLQAPPSYGLCVNLEQPSLYPSTKFWSEQVLKVIGLNCCVELTNPAVLLDVLFVLLRGQFICLFFFCSLSSCLSFSLRFSFLSFFSCHVSLSASFVYQPFHLEAALYVKALLFEWSFI